MLRLIWSSHAENFQRKQDYLKRSPKISQRNFQTENVVTFHLLLSTISRRFGVYPYLWKCPWKWNTHIPWKFLFGAFDQPVFFIKCNTRLTASIWPQTYFFLPILLYGSEVWGIYDKDDLNFWEKDEIEKTHIFFCKNTLDVNKQCPYVAARNELGRLPLKLAIETAIIKFWIHLQNLPDKNIAMQCLQLSKEMAEKEQPGRTQKIIKGVRRAISLIRKYIRQSLI